MSYAKNRAREKSTAFGLGIAAEPILRLVLTKGTDITAWGQLAAGVAAILIPTTKKAKTTPE